MCNYRGTIMSVREDIKVLLKEAYSYFDNPYYKAQLAFREVIENEMKKNDTEDYKFDYDN